MTEKKKAPVPVPPWENQDAYALQALERGAASPEQQKRALKWIVERACAFYEIDFNPESDRLCAHFAGRRFAGAQILKLITINMSEIKKREVRPDQKS